MARFSSLLAFGAIAISALSYAPGASGSALDAGFVQRREAMSHHHGLVAKRQSAGARRCPNKAKASTAPAPASATEINVDSSSSSSSTTHSSSHTSSSAAPTTRSSTASPTTRSTSTHTTTTTTSKPPPPPPTSTHKPTSSSTTKNSTTTTKSSTTAKPSSTAKPTSKPTSTQKPTSSAAPPKTTSLGAAPSTGRKVGLSWNLGLPDSALKQWKTSKVGGLYNWTPQCPQIARDVGIPCIPSLWGDKNTGNWLNTVTRGYANMAMGANEVNQAGQATMSPQHGAQLWKQYMIPLISRGYRLISHSTNNAPSGLDWHKQYRAACPECWNTTDYLNLHWYGIDADNFIDYITTMHNQLDNKPVIVTEFACQDFSGQNKPCPDVNAFMNKVTSWMDSTSWVYMYFWFGVEPDVGGGVDQVNGLMNPNGSPNRLGQNYIN